MSSTSLVIRDFLNQIPGELCASKEWVFPTVSSTNAHGRETFWRVIVRVVDEEGRLQDIEKEYFNSAIDLGGLRAEIRVESGVVGGKVRDTVPTYVTKGKNLGKKSQTNAWTQALRDALGMYNKQMKKAIASHKDLPENEHSSEQPKTIKLYPPMLAQVFTFLPLEEKTPQLDKINKMEKPVAVQPKYNGLRLIVGAKVDIVPSITVKSIVAFSRGLRPYPNLDHIKTELESLFVSLAEQLAKLTNDKILHIYVDGELYSHGMSLQDINSLARRAGANDKELKFMIFDMFLAPGSSKSSKSDMPFAQRWSLLVEADQKSLLTKDRQMKNHIELVDTHFDFTFAQMENYYRDSLSRGFEGIMIRANAPYRFSYNNYHAPALLKWKPTLDHEFEIVDWGVGKSGKAANALMIVCKVAENGKQFTVTPVATIEAREALAAKMKTIEPNNKTHFENQWLGKKIIVYFDEYSKLGVPQRARTKMEIREWD